VVCGVSRIRGAILAAVLYTAIPRLFGLDVVSAVGLFGFAALFLGKLPGGLVGQLDRLPALVRRKLGEAYREAQTPPPVPPPMPVPTPFAERILAERNQ
jgi:hypothetical protein